MRSVSAKSGSRGTRADQEVRPTTDAAPPLPGWLQMIVLGIAAICLIGLFSTEADDTDFWWHLKTGQYIVQQHALPVPDPFAYTTAMNPPSYPGEEQLRHFNLTHEWLAQAIMYGVYSIGGLPGVILSRAALLAALCGLVGLLSTRRTGKFYAGIAAAFATASVATWVAVDRPMIVTFLFVAVFITVLEFRRGLWFLPAVALIWANCHGGFFLGWVVMLIYCASEWRRLWLVTACAIAVSALNPNGLGVISTLFRYRQSPMTASLVEWHRPYLWGSPYAFDLLLYAAALTLFLSWRKVRLTDWLLFAAFAGAALLAFRNILLIGLLAPILIATYFPFRFRIPRATAWAVPAVLIGVLAAGVVRGSFFQLRGAMWKFPVGAADYLLANRVPGPLFNTYEHGGYLIWRLWPQYKVFIDGRSLSETLYKDYQQILSNTNSVAEEVAGPRADLLKRYGIQAVVMNTFEFNRGGAYTLALALGNPATTDWQLVYDDAQSLVFLHQPPPGTPVFADKLPHVVDHLERECTANIEHSPVTYLCARTLADLWMRAGDTRRARRMLQLYLQHTMYRDPQAEDLLRQLR
jgi:hypothetical protein